MDEVRGNPSQLRDPVAEVIPGGVIVGGGPKGMSGAEGSESQ